MASGAWISQQNVHYNNWNTSLVLSGTSSWMVCSHNHILICLPYRLMGNKASSDQILTGLLQYRNGVSQDGTGYWRLGVEQGYPKTKKVFMSIMPHAACMCVRGQCFWVQWESECLTWDVDCPLLDSTCSCYSSASPEGPEHSSAIPRPCWDFTGSVDVIYKMSSTLPVWLSSISASPEGLILLVGSTHHKNRSLIQSLMPHVMHLTTSCEFLVVTHLLFHTQTLANCINAQFLWHVTAKAAKHFAYGWGNKLATVPE